MRDEDDKGQHFWHDSCSRGSRVSPTKVSPFQARTKLRFLGEQKQTEKFFLCGDFFVMTRVFFFKNGSKSSHF